MERQKVQALLQELTELTQRRYKFTRFLGSGSFGTVLAAIDQKTGKEVAIKLIEDLFGTQLNAIRVLREIRILSHLHLDTITSLHSVTTLPDFQNFNKLVLIIDLMDTDLQQVIDSEQTLNIEHRRYFMYHILRALKYIHSSHVVHRDLKPSNVLVNAHTEIKLCDFGLSRIVGDPYDLEQQKELVMSRWYRAPEVLLNIQNYGPAIDIWSAGCIFAELINRKPLFPGQSSANLLTLIVQALGSPTGDDLKSCANPAARQFMASLPRANPTPFKKLFLKAEPIEIDLIQKMLTWDPAKRISAENALKHPFFTSLHDPFGEPVTLPFPEFEFDKKQMSIDQLKVLLWEEVRRFNPSFE